MKRFLSLLLSVIIIAGCLCMWSCDFNRYIDPENSKYVQMEFEGYGSIVIEIYHDAAPITAENFVRLVQDGFYDGLTIFRAQRNFVIQGGRDYNTRVDPIVGEFASNGHNNPLSHKRGVISMARTSDPNSATSQFFITLHDSAAWSLDGEYAAFGVVVEGMDVVDAVAAALFDHAIDSMGFVGNADAIKITCAKVIER
jgi:peptidyl-prolyl cis-trans isomerase B (cyclophilin B)